MEKRLGEGSWVFRESSKCFMSGLERFQTVSVNFFIVRWAH